MNDVTSLEVSKELYEVSGWNGTKEWWFYEDSFPDLAEWELASHDMSGKALPAYSLGYLLRKLYKSGIQMPTVTALAINYRWRAEMLLDVGGTVVSEADTPEDAAAKLCLELFRQGILEKENDNVS